jgi:hypothetical protein
VSTLALSTVGLVAVALAAYLGVAKARVVLAFGRRRKPARQRGPTLDPGAERRAERRARALLKSIVNREEWEMYRDLGFIRVLGQKAQDRVSGSAAYGYLIYPHKPIVAYLPVSSSLLSEYCVEFPDLTESLFGPKLPDSDDVLAKWMMITADEERLLGDANMHLPGRQVDPQQVRRDLWRLAEWEKSRARAARGAGRARGVDRSGGPLAAESG